MPSQCNHVRACGLSNPLDAFEEFCTTYPDLKVNHCDSLQDVQLSQDLLAILQSDVVLDPRQTGPRTGLDTIKFAESNNFLAQLCVQSAKVAKNRLASRSAPFRHQQSNKAANQQAEQWAVFSEVISGPDAYVLKLLCHQVIAPELLAACSSFSLFGSLSHKVTPEASCSWCGIPMQTRL